MRDVIVHVDDHHVGIGAGVLAAHALGWIRFISRDRQLVAGGVDQSELVAHDREVRRTGCAEVLADTLRETARLAVLDIVGKGVHYDLRVSLRLASFMRLHVLHRRLVVPFFVCSIYKLLPIKRCPRLQNSLECK